MVVALRAALVRGLSFVCAVSCASSCFGTVAATKQDNQGGAVVVGLWIPTRFKLKLPASSECQWNQRAVLCEGHGIHAPMLLNCDPLLFVAVVLVLDVHSRIERAMDRKDRSKWLVQQNKNPCQSAVADIFFESTLVRALDTRCDSLSWCRCHNNRLSTTSGRARIASLGTHTVWRAQLVSQRAMPNKST